MEQVVYGDVLFLINFSMDYLSLYICARVLHRRIKTLPFAIAAAFGGAYSVASLFIELPGALLLLLDISAAFIMCAAAYEISKSTRLSLSRCALSALVFFLCEMLLGGAVTALFNLLGRSSLSDLVNIGDIDPAYSDIPLWMFVFLAAVSTVITYFGGRLLGRGAREKTVGIKIENGGNTLTFSALVDSGDLLSDPISGRPVVVIGFEKIKNFLPAELRSYILCNDTERLETMPYESAKRIRFIPASGIGGSGVLVGFVPERMTVSAGKNKRDADAVVAIQKNAGDFGGCDAIAPPSLAVK